MPIILTNKDNFISPHKILHISSQMTKINLLIKPPFKKNSNRPLKTKINFYLYFNLGLIHVLRNFKKVTIH